MRAFICLGLAYSPSHETVDYIDMSFKKSLLCIYYSSLSDVTNQ